MKKEFDVQPLPLPDRVTLETSKVMKHLNKSSRFLAELKGAIMSIPNQYILIDTLVLQESRDSSEVENIVTTQDELYKEKIELFNTSIATKEVSHYAKALSIGFELIQKDGLLLNKHILKIQEAIERNNAGFRKQSVVLRDTNNKLIYTPPESYKIEALMENLEKYINDDEMSDLDPLIKMTIIHYQFETIHPFYDGNGRTGRIINILYLVLKDLLNIPILYLSRYVNQNKNTYYRLLQETREGDSASWEEYIVFFLKGIEETSKSALQLVKGIKALMMQYKHQIRSDHAQIYSQDLLNNIFKYPYTKIDYLQKELGCSRQTASKYLLILCDAGILKKEKAGRQHYFVNTKLVALLHLD